MTNRISSPGAALGILDVDDEAFENLVHPLHHRVDLAGAEADAAAVQGRVGAPRDHAAAALGEHDPVTVAPDAGEELEVGGAISRTVVVSPEADRHRGHRGANHELAELADHGPGVLVEGGDVDREAATGDLAPVDGLERAPLHHPGADVGSAAAHVEEDVGAELLVDPVESLRRQRRAGGGELADAGEVELAQVEAALPAPHQHRWNRAHQGRPELLGEPPLGRVVGIHRVPVEHHDRRPKEQGGDERVPHHPGGGGEPHQAVAGLEIPAEPVVLIGLDQDPAVAVDDRLRQPRRPRREQDAEGMVEGDGVERERPRLGDQPIPLLGVLELVLGTSGIGNVNDVLEAGQGGGDLGDLGAAVDRLLAVGVPGDRKQQLRLQLAEAVDHAPRPELRCTRRPDRAEARGREKRDQGLRNVREVGDHPVALSDPESLKSGACPRHLITEVSEGEVDRPPRLRAGEHRDRVGVLVAPEHVLGVVQAGAGEPLRTGHLPRAEDPLVWRPGPDLEELPERAPEPLEVIDRPAPELVVAGMIDPAGVAEPLEVAPELGLLANVGGRRPHHLSDLGAPLDHRLAYCQVV